MLVVAGADSRAAQPRPDRSRRQDRRRRRLGTPRHPATAATPGQGIDSGTGRRTSRGPTVATGAATRFQQQQRLGDRQQQQWNLRFVQQPAMRRRSWAPSLQTQWGPVQVAAKVTATAVSAPSEPFRHRTVTIGRCGSTPRRSPTSSKRYYRWQRQLRRRLRRHRHHGGLPEVVAGNPRPGMTSQPPVQRRSWQVMGTVASLIARLRPGDSRFRPRRGSRRAVRHRSAMSSYRPDSEVSRFAAGQKRQRGRVQT